MADEDYRKIELIMALRNQGIRDTNVLRALERVPRENFVPASFKEQAYDDQSLPIECGQTISQPFMVATMTELIGPTPGRKVLEIGTGSGYQAAILAALSIADEYFQAASELEALRRDVTARASALTERLRAETASPVCLVIRVIARKPHDLRIAFESEDVRRDAIQEPAIVRNHDGRSRELE